MEHELEEFEMALTPTALARSVQASQEKIARGDYSEVEAQLVTQAMTLQRLFEVYTQKMIATEFLGAQEIFGNLAFRAQSQGLKTLRALIDLKNPKMNTFIKEQMNTQINVKQTSGDA